jgi:hypothetical protein
VLSQQRSVRGLASSGADGWLFVLLVAMAALGLAMVNPADHSLKTRFLSLVLIALCTAPLAHWLFQRERPGLPIFELFMLFHAICFGFAGMMPQASSLTTRTPVSEDEWDRALIAVLLSLTGTTAAYYIALARARSTARGDTWPFRFTPALFGLAFPGMLVLLTGVYVFRAAIPKEVNQPVQALVLFWFVVLVAAAFQDQLRQPRRSLVLFGLVPVNALLFSSFGDATLYGLFGILIPVALARFSVAKRLPWVLATVVVIVFVVLQPVKADFRTLASREKVGRFDMVVDFPLAAVERFEAAKDAGMTPWDWFVDAFRRLNHLHVTAAIIADTPAFVPYAYGSTYVPLFTKLVPRAIWPNKPLEDQGNAWAQQYGYLSTDDDVTSFNLPFLPEMYMNFGYPGLMVLGILLGVALGITTSRVWSRDGDSSFTAFSILLATPFLTPESNLSLLLGHAVIGGTTAYLSLLVLQSQIPDVRVTRRRNEVAERRLELQRPAKSAEHARNSGDLFV